MKRKNIYEANLKKSYALIIEYCSKTIQSRIESDPQYESNIQDDLIELLKKIKIIMHDPEKSKYPFASLTEAVNRLVNLKQYDKENLLEYSKRFKQAKDTMVAKALFLSKRACPDIQPTVAVLCTRVQEPNESDWNKLTRLMKYLNDTRGFI